MIDILLFSVIMLNIGAMISFIVFGAYVMEDGVPYSSDHPIMRIYSWIHKTLKKLRVWNSIHGRLMFVLSYIIQALAYAIYTWALASVLPYYYGVELIWCSLRWLIYGTWVWGWKVKKKVITHVSCEDCCYCSNGLYHLQSSIPCSGIENMPQNSKVN